MKPVPELKFGTSVQRLVDFCCTVCTPMCCGIDAFNFTPLRIASYIYEDPNREVFESELEVYKNELAILLKSSEQLEPNENEMICTISGMNQCFSRKSLETFVLLLQQNIELAPQVFQYSFKLEKAKGEQEKT